MRGGVDVEVWRLGGGVGVAFVALRHAEKNSPQRQAATTGERAIVPPYGGASVTTPTTVTLTRIILSLFFTSSSSFTLPSPNIPELCRIKRHSINTVLTSANGSSVG